MKEIGRLFAGFAMIVLGAFAAMMAGAAFTMPGANEPMCGAIVADGAGWYFAAVISAALPAATAAVLLLIGIPKR